MVTVAVTVMVIGLPFPPPGALPTSVGPVAGEPVVDAGRMIVARVVGTEGDKDVDKAENVIDKLGFTTTGVVDVVVVVDTD